MKSSRAFPAIALAGLIAGILDISSAFVIVVDQRRGFATRMLQGIAAGLLGQRSFEGGMATAGLGLALHFFDSVYGRIGFLPGQPEDSNF